MQREHDGSATVVSGNALGRRDFLKISATGVGGALFIGALGSSSAVAQTPGNGGGSSRATLVQEFREAAREYDVPLPVLLAIGYVNTRWEMPPPEASAYERGDPHGWGGHGIMALVQDPSSDTLAEAAELTGISEEELKRDRASNIKGGAALLAASQGDDKPGNVAEWFQALGGDGRPSRGAEEIDSTSGVGGGELYASQVFETLGSGARKRTQDGEDISLSAQQLSGEIRQRISDRISAVPGRGGDD